MLFKNVVLFQLPKSYKLNKNLEEAFAQYPLRPCGALEKRTEGFVSPFGETGPILDEQGNVLSQASLALTHELDGRSLFTIGFEEKVLPAGVINKALKEEIARIEIREERKVKGKEKKKLKEEIIDRLLPKAFVRPGQLQGYIDIKESWVVFNTSGVKGAENGLSLIRKALGTCPAIPVPSENGRLFLTQWLSSKSLPEGLVLGEECELKDPGEGGGTIKCTKQDLTVDEVQDHIKAGKQVTKLALSFDEKIHFMLNETLSISKIKLEGVKEDGEGEDLVVGASVADKIDAEFALMVLELSQLFTHIRDWFEFERPEKEDSKDEN